MKRADIRIALQIKWFVLLFLFLTIVSWPFIAGAVTVASGTCGDNASWQLDDSGMLVISGSGSMSDYNYSNSNPWYSKKYTIHNVVIQDGITRIGDRAFYFAGIDQGMSIPQSVVSIGEYALLGNSLQSIEVSSGNSSFSSLDGVLYDRAKTKLIKCPEKKIGVSIPSSVLSIGDNSFYNCSSLEEVILPESVTSIGNSAFSNCSSLKKISIPESITQFGSHVFYFCSALQQFTIPDTITVIPNDFLCGCSSLLSLTIPKSITRIESFAFSYCSNIKSFTIPDSVTLINDYAFSHCSSLENITIPYGATLSGSNIFTDCSSNLCINCHKSSAAATYASDHNLKYTYEGHDEIADNDILPGCTKEGWTGRKHCSICGELPAQSVPALGHAEYEVVVREPTCTNAGQTDIYCERCGVLIESKTLVPLGHIETTVTTLEPTCSETGNQEIRCERCKIVISKTVLPVISHDLEKHEMLSPTCTEKGIATYYKCKMCEKLFSDPQAIIEIDAPVQTPAKGHTLEKMDVTSSGIDAYWKCTVCNMTFSDDQGENIVKVTANTKESIKYNSGTIKSDELMLTDGTISITYPNGDTYTGEVVGGRKSGQGRYVWKGKGYYDGQFSNDDLNGNGSYFYFDNDSSYELRGVFKDGECVNGTLFKDSIEYLIIPESYTKSVYNAPDFVLPASLIRIEEEAYAGIKRVKIEVPSSVKWIAEDAFDPSVTIICEKGSYAEKRCKELGLTVVTK